MDRNQRISGVKYAITTAACHWMGEKQREIVSPVHRDDTLVFEGITVISQSLAFFDINIEVLTSLKRNLLRYTVRCARSFRTMS